MIQCGQVCNTSGYFWHPDNQSKKYPGTLDYSIENGIQIILMDCREKLQKPIVTFLDDTSYLHGYVLGIGYVTLINFRSLGVKSEGNDDYYLSELLYVQYLVCGYCINPKDCILNGISFSLPELAYMIDDNPVEFKTTAECPVLEEKLSSDLIIRIIPNTRNSIDIRNQRLNLQENHNYLMQSDYYVELVGNDNTLDYYLNLLFQMEKLFSILCNRQVKAPYVFFKYNENEFQILYKLQINGLPIPNKSYLPITIENIRGKFELIWKKWQEIINYDLVDRYVTDRFYQLVPPGALQYCLLIPMIEAWQFKHGHKNQNQYQNYFQETLSDNDGPSCKIRDELFKCTNVTSFEELGQAITDIRSLILHADRISDNASKRKKYGKFLSDHELTVYFSELINLVVAIRFFKELELKQTEQQKDNLINMYFANIK